MKHIKCRECGKYGHEPDMLRVTHFYWGISLAMGGCCRKNQTIYIHPECKTKKYKSSTKIEWQLID